MVPFAAVLTLLACAGARGAARPDLGDSGACPYFQLQDDAGVCVPDACGTSLWPEGVDGDTIFVDGGAADGGDGSEATPLQTVQAGVDAAGARGGGLVAVAAGTYAENLVLGDGDAGISVAGRCRELVVLDGSAGDGLATLSIIGTRKVASLALSDVTVTGGSYGVVVGNGTVGLTDVDVVGNTNIGVIASTGATLTLKTSTITGTLPERRKNGFGLQAENGAQATVHSSTIDGNTELGVLASDIGTTLTMYHSTISNTLTTSAGTEGYGLVAQTGASVRMIGGSIERNTSVGVWVQSSVTSVSLDSVDIDATVPDGSGDFGFGAQVSSGGTLVTAGCALNGNANAGLIVDGVGANASLTDPWVVDTLPLADGTGGYGVEVENGGSITLSRGWVEGNASAGIWANGAGSHASLVDTDVTDTLAGAGSGGDSRGMGIWAQSGAVVDVSGGTLASNTVAGVVASDDGTTVSLDGVTVTDTQPNASGEYGLALDVMRGAAMTCTGCTLTESVNAAVAVGSEGSTLDLEDSLVWDTWRGTDASMAVGAVAETGGALTASNLRISYTQGPGVYVVAGGSLTCSGCEIDENSYAGVLLLDGVAALDDATIHGNYSDVSLGGGFGVYVNNRSGPPSLSLTNSFVENEPYAAVWLDGAGTYDIEDDVLSGGDGVPVGANTIHGNAVFAENGVPAWDGTTGLYLGGDSLGDASDVALLLDDSSAVLDGDSWSLNATDVRQQRCEDVVAIPSDQLSAAPSTAICPGTNLLTAYDLVFSTLDLPVVATAG